MPQHEAWAKLSELVQPKWGSGGGYAYDGATATFAHPALVEGSVQQVLGSHGPVLVK